MLYDKKGQPRCAIMVVNPVVTTCFLESLSTEYITAAEIMVWENRFYAISAYIPPRESRCAQFA